MAEYIYCINPEKETIRDLYENDGIVVWNIPCASNKVCENDIIYLYINKGDKKDSYICYSECVAYVATVLEVLACRDNKKLLKLYIRNIAPFAIKKLSKKALDEVVKNHEGKNQGFHPSQSYPIDLDARIVQGSKHPSLKIYINDILYSSKTTSNKANTISAIPKTYEEKMVCEFESIKEIFNESINNSSKNKRCNKLNGNIASNIISKYIQTVIDKYDLPYRVSEPNVYIQGCNTEWDALILKKDSFNILGCNLYNLQDVVAVLEYKSSGLFYKYSDPEKASKPLKNITDSVNAFNSRNPSPIKVGYITLHEREDDNENGKGKTYLTDTKNAFERDLKNNTFFDVFCLINSTGNVLYDNGKTWDQFILSLLP